MSSSLREMKGGSKAERRRYRLETDNFFGTVGSTRMTLKSEIGSECARLSCKLASFLDGGELFWSLLQFCWCCVHHDASLVCKFLPSRMKIMDEKFDDYFWSLGTLSSSGIPLEIKKRILMSSLNALKQNENHVYLIILTSVRLAYQETMSQLSASQAESPSRRITIGSYQLTLHLPIMFSDYNSMFTTAAGLSFPVSRLSNMYHARAPPLVMGQEEIKVRQRLSTQCLPTRAPSPVGFSEDAASDKLDGETYPFKFTYPPSLAHTILAGGDDLYYDEESPLLVPTTPRFVSPRDVSAPSFSNESTEHGSFFPSPTGSAIDKYEEEEEENPEAVFAGQTRRRTNLKCKRSIQAGMAIRKLVGEDTPLKTQNGRFICRWGIVVGGGCADTFVTAQSHDRHVASHVPDAGGDVLRTFLCRFCLHNPGTKSGAGRFSRRDPCKRHIVSHLAKVEQHSWRSHMLIRKRPWWWPSPLFVTGSFNVERDEIEKRPKGETRSWLEYLYEVVQRAGDTLEENQRKVAPVDSRDDDSEPGPSRRRSKRARRS
ncbi:hypothetical protein ACEPAG_4339 [Sanghuangporus baumii]